MGLQRRRSRDLKILGDMSGYSSIPAAEKEIKSESGACKDVVSRA